MIRRFAFSMLVTLIMCASSQAATINPFTTVFDTDWTLAGLSGLRGLGSGSISVSGVSGTVSSAYLYWHGPTNSADPNINATVDFNGTQITGTNIGTSGDNNWGFLNSHAYRADVTSLVTGNGSYTVGQMIKTGPPRADVNGVSLAVFFDDGDNSNNRDVVIFDGNDSNIGSFDPQGWQASLSGINYSGGTASLAFGVADGQDFGNDEAVLLNGNIIFPVGPTWQGDTLPDAGGGAPNGNLWDIRTIDISSLLSPGPNSLSLTSSTGLTDALGLIHLMFNLPAGAAPEQPPPSGTVPEPSSLAIFSVGLVGLLGAKMRRIRTKRNDA